MQIEGKPYKVKENESATVNEQQPFRSDVCKIIDKIAKIIGYTKYELTKELIPKNGSGYMGVHYEVDIKGSTAEGPKETNLFLKHAINGDHRTFVSVAQAYKKESFAYKELSKAFTEIQDEAEIPNEERFKIARCYDSNAEVIVLENLAKRGFSTNHRMDCMPLSFTKLCLEQMAKFHSLFHILKKKRPEFLKNNAEMLKPALEYNDDWNVFMINMCDLAKTCIDNTSKEKVEKYKPKMIEKFHQFENDTTSIGCTICHGDVNADNFLVRDDNGEALEVVLVDYQLFYYGCPLNDILYFIYTGTDRKFRKKHMEYLKSHYYNNLAKFLNYFDCNVEEIYPKKEFERQYQERLEFGLIKGLIISPLTFNKEENIPDMANEDIRDFKFVIDPRGYERIQGLVDEFVELGYF